MVRATTSSGPGASEITDPSAYRLEPEIGIRMIAGRPCAISLPFWFRLEPAALVARHRWVKIRYSGGIFDECARPLIRFVTKDRETLCQPMNGPLLGSAEWIGRVPDDTVAILISPGRRLGPISFRIESVTAASALKMMARGLLSNLGGAIWAIRSRFMHSSEETAQALKFAAGGSPLASYNEWRKKFSRPLDLGGLDRPLSDWATAPPFRLLMPLDSCDAHAVDTTIASLTAQVFTHWTLHVSPTDRTAAHALAAFRRHAGQDSRFVESAREDPVDFSNQDRIAVIQPGDSLEIYALAALLEEFGRDPTVTAIYSDEDSIDPHGKFHSPILKPDWSPIYRQTSRYVGRLACVKYATLVSCGIAPSDFALDEDKAFGAIFAASASNHIGHVRRVLYHKRSGLSGNEGRRRSLIEDDGQEMTVWPEVSIILPTRNHASLLKQCIKGLRETTDYPSFSVIVVDHASTEPETLSLLAELRADPQFDVMEQLGTFNFSKFCNDGAELAKGPVLVFLNDDIEMLEPGWLKALVRWAVKPGIGVVGAKLLYPAGTIQHAGVVLGMGGMAGHVYRRHPSDDPGYLSQLKTAREVTAVTAACVAIEKSKFVAASGFDADNLPIELNDVDLCLRVAALGLTNIWTPEAVLIHVESATRGRERDSFVEYREQKHHFVQQWTEAIRDDRYYHPAFELFERGPSLG